MKHAIVRLLCLGLLIGLAPAALARPSSDDDSSLPHAVDLSARQAGADLRQAASWLARCYEVPERVPQEMFLAGYTYSDALVAFAMMHKGASLNELLEQRRKLRWAEVARQVEIDPNTLPEVIKPLLPLGFVRETPDLLHFLPDVYPGLKHDLTINAFPPTIPNEVQKVRFNMSNEEVANIRRALDDPFGVPESLMLETGGKNALIVGDWVLAGVIAHHRPLSMESILSARGGQQLSWQEICLAFGVRPDVLTKGPLTGVYPIMSGYTPGTILCARKREHFPEGAPLIYEFSRMAINEREALRPLMLRAYEATPVEAGLLERSNLGLADQSIALQLSRLSGLALQQIIDYHTRGTAWNALPTRLGLDLTGEDALRRALSN